MQSHGETMQSHGETMQSHGETVADPWGNTEPTLWPAAAFVACGICRISDWLVGYCLRLDADVRIDANFAFSAVSSAEDPEKLLDTVVAEMTDDLTRMRQASACVDAHTCLGAHTNRRRMCMSALLAVR
eukprot:364747-Chlamydomonas_euryale.AAC.5